MQTREETKMFKSLLDEKHIYSEKINEVYDLILSENYDEALYELENINKRYPYMVDVYHLRFKIYCIKENYILAEKVLISAEVNFSENEKIKEDRAFLRRVKQGIYNQHLINGDYEKIAEMAEKDIKNGDSNNIVSSSYYYRALSYRMLKNEDGKGYYNQACRVYGNLTGKAENNIFKLLYKALSYKDMKDYSEALRIVNSILQKDCENKEALKIKMSIVKELKKR